jgi:hypothetical protein
MVLILVRPPAQHRPSSEASHLHRRRYGLLVRLRSLSTLAQASALVLDACKANRVSLS